MAMKRIYKIFILGCLALMASEVKAQDKKDLFNPVNYAVISQTIAPDARGGGLGDIGAATDPDVPVLESGKISFHHFACRCFAQFHPLAALAGQ